MLNVLNYQREGWIYKKEIILKEICKIECNNAIHLQFMWKLIIMVDFEAHSYSSNNEHTCWSLNTKYAFMFDHDSKAELGKISFFERI